ncbi:Rpn family recombination-promoting nuclease/putative transposase [Treponema sp. R80B11-R83G3]
MVSNNQNLSQEEWGFFPFEDGTHILDIRYDQVFKAVFTRGTSASRGALSDLISALIGRIVVVETIVANEPATGFLGQKKIRYDISCMSKNGEPIDVEMSFHPIDDELNRVEYFASRLFVGQEIEGIEKTYSDLKETYQISILAQKPFFPDKYLTHNFQFYDPQTNVSLDGKIRIITLELEKADAFIGKPIEEMTNAEQWAAYFQYLTDETKREKIKEIIDHEEGIAMATNTLRQVSAEYEAYALQTSLMKGELDWRSGMKDAERRGHREGRNEANLENARKMKTMGFLMEQIQAVTGLSPEAIAQL